MILNRCFSRSLEIRLRREMGQEGGDVLGIGMIVEILKAEEKTPVDTERLNMWARGTEIKWGVL